MEAEIAVWIILGSLIVVGYTGEKVQKKTHKKH